MSSTTAAGTTIAISASAPVAHNIFAYAALTFMEIGAVEKIGAIGPNTSKTEFQPLKGAKEKHKGPTDFGALNPTLAHDKSDAGQALLRNAAEPDNNALYSFLVTYPNGGKRYFRGRVFSYPENVDGADSIITAAPTIEISTKVLRDDGETPSGAILSPLDFEVLLSPLDDEIMQEAD